MSDAFSRRGFGSLLLSGGAGLLLGTATSRASALEGPPVPVTTRIATRLGTSGLEVELHLRNVRGQPLLLPRGLISVSGRLHTQERSYPLASMVDSLRLGSIQSRVGPRRPPPLSLDPDVEGHYATFRGPVPEGLTGRGRGRVQLAASRAPSPPGGDSSAVVHRLAELRLRGPVRYSV